MQRFHMSRASFLALVALVAFAFLACTLQGTRKTYAPVAPQEWQKERGPVVPHDSFPRDCSLCHEGSTWHVIRKDFVFDHERETGVALEGAHAAAECLRCHNDRGPVGQFAVQGCSGCHEDEHRGVLGKNCADCHTQRDWRPNDMVSRHARTRFPLVGAHAAVACFRCHEGADVGNFDRTSTDCESCHASQLALATSPNHVAQGWTTNCERCHAPTTWGDGGFTHAQFPLTGQHATATCNECHVNDQFAGTPNTCAACHQSDYASTTNPNHAVAGISTDCRPCHTTSTWEGASYPHTSWPLTGSHVGQDCSACHASGQFQGLPNTCVSCHQGDYNGVTDPPHAAANLPTTCQDCHNTSAWSRSTFAHQGITSGCVTCHQNDYVGATNPNHVAQGYSTQCQSCHTNFQTWEGASFDHAGITNGCVTCHQSDYNGATDPNHVTLNISTQCQTCHTNFQTWEGATFNHAGITNGCVNCHQADYDGATNPNHVAQGYSTQCQTCHTSFRTWDGASFAHTGITNGCVNCHQGDYNGATSPNHVALNISTQCQTCHTNFQTWEGATFNHAGITNGCLNCHQTDYNTASPPNHAGLGYPTNCQFCHTTTTWDSNFSHTSYFPLTGHHNVACTQCHTNTANPATFTCLICHTQGPTNNDHNGVSGYSYNSNACYNCHPDGND